MPISNNILAGSGQGGGDLGDPIDQSILFDGVYGAEYLTRTMGAGDNRKKFTVSTWVKRVELTTANHNTFWIYHNNPNVIGFEFRGHHLRFYHYDSSGTFNAEYVSNATFRDTTAWYHLVAAVDTTQSTSTDRLKLWVNGVRVTSFSTQNTFPLNYDTFAGVNGYTNLIGVYADLSSNQWKGYIAQTIFLDGIAADETDFGKYNSDGVWVPQNYSGSYGTNGYRLLYEQGNGNTIGTDSSTNSNDFTKSTAVSTYADGTSWSGLAPNWTTANYGAHPRAIFDSKYSTASSFYYGGPGTAYLDNLGAALGTGVTEIKITHYPRMGTNTFTINGTATSASGNSNQEMTVSHDGSAITSMSWAGTDVAHYGVGGIKVNGMVLTDQRRVNCLDTPTDNQTIVSPIDNGNKAQLDFNFGGLAISGKTTQYQVTRATFAVDSGKWYWECRLTNTDKGTYYPSQGIASVDTMDLEANSQAGGANFANSPQYMANGQKYISTVLSGYGASFDLGDVIGIALDMDAGTLTCYKNGVSQGVLTSGLSGTFTMCANNYAAATSVSAYAETDYNFSGPFVYTPPTGHNALAVSNDTEPTIKNGKEYCNTVSYSGDGATTRTLTAGFQPDLIWSKSKSHSTSHFLYDSVRGFGANKELVGDSNNEEGNTGSPATDANGYVSGVTSDGFTVNGGSAGVAYTNQGNRTYVAWCWKAGDTASQTYTVKVVSSKFRFDDFAANAVTLDLEEGGTYVFDQSDSSNAGHPLRFSTTSDGTHGGGSEYTTGVTTEGTPGSAGAKTTITVASGAPTLYYYCSAHSGMGGQADTNDTKGSSNFAGTIQSKVTANTDAGFSIVSYTGNAQNNQTIGHGLTQAPELVIYKERDAQNSWYVYHNELPLSGSYYQRVLLDTNGAVTTSAGGITTKPDNSVLKVNNHGMSNAARRMIAYCWHSVKGYSKIGQYIGSTNLGSHTDEGEFVYCGFKPQWLIIKSTYTGNWIIVDDVRNDFNPRYTQSQPDIPDPDVNMTTDAGIDFTANGFKIRQGGSRVGDDGVQYVYMAFASNPFGGENTAPNPAG